MFEIIFYEDNKGIKPIAEYITELRKQSYTSKHARINFNKIVAYLDLLEEKGTRIGEPVTKHLDGDIWELRPLDNRILYAFYKDNTFILLHYFIKKTNKTPPREIEQAKRNLADYIGRNEK
jgi:phage-related protein